MKLNARKPKKLSRRSRWPCLNLHAKASFRPYGEFRKRLQEHAHAWGVLKICMGKTFDFLLRQPPLNEAGRGPFPRKPCPPGRRAEPRLQARPCAIGMSTRIRTRHMCFSPNNVLLWALNAIFRCPPWWMVRPPSRGSCLPLYPFLLPFVRWYVSLPVSHCTSSCFPLLDGVSAFRRVLSPLVPHCTPSCFPLLDGAPPS